MATALVLASGVAHAAGPSTADCLAASEASFKAADQHMLRAERSELLICADVSCPADIRKECISRVGEVNLQLPTIIFAAKDASGGDLSAVRVSMDGEVLAERLEGIALPVDPGQHVFTYETVGKTPVTKQIIVQEAQKDRRESVTFGAATTVAEGTATRVLPTTEAQTRGGHGLGVQEVLAIVVGGIGIAGLGVGTAFGFVALSKKSDATTLCPNECATKTGVNEWHAATIAGNVSTVGLVVGGALLAGGAALWFTATSKHHQGSSAQVGMGPGFFQLKGVW